MIGLGEWDRQGAIIPDSQLTEVKQHTRTHGRTHARTHKHTHTRACTHALTAVMCMPPTSHIRNRGAISCLYHIMTSPYTDLMRTPQVITDRSPQVCECVCPSSQCLTHITCSACCDVATLVMAVQILPMVFRRYSCIR